MSEMLRFLADENFPGETVRVLRAQGRDVAWVCEDQSSANDEQILARSHRDQRVLLTLDKDFGELVYRLGTACSAGVILFRLGPLSSEWMATTATAAVTSRDDWAGMFSVVEPGRVRMSPLPRSGA